MNKRMLASPIILTLAAVSLLASAFPARSLETSHATTPPLNGSVRVHPSTSVSAVEVLELRVEVSYKGWNGTPDFMIEAEEGQQIEITFVWADTAVPDNAHRIRIEGYDLSTPLLDSENREHTVEFIADTTGTFEIECDWRCEGHKEALQDAALVVNDAANAGGEEETGAEPARQSTTMSIVSAVRAVAGDPLMLQAELKDEAGEPVAGAPVQFVLLTSFAGTEGEMEVGNSETDAAGIASFGYKPTSPGEHTFIARFPGQGLYAETERATQIDVANAAPAYMEADKGLEAIRGWAPVVLLALLGTVWGTFGYVLYQVVRIRGSEGS